MLVFIKYCDHFKICLIVFKEDTLKFYLKEDKLNMDLMLLYTQTHLPC